MTDVTHSGWGRCICGYQGKINRLEADRDRWRIAAEQSLHGFDTHDGGCPAHPRQIALNRTLREPRTEQCDCGRDAYNHALAKTIEEEQK
jgi:hypothetical protein